MCEKCVQLREQAVFNYCIALEEGDTGKMGPTLAASLQDPELRRVLGQVHEAWKRETGKDGPFIIHPELMKPALIIDDWLVPELPETL